MKCCLTCGKEYAPRKATQKWCSKPCTRKGIPRSPEVRAKISASHIGMRPSLETIEKLSKAKLGKVGNRKGKSMSEETRRNLSLSRRGEKSPAWKGGLTSLIRQIRRGLKYRSWRTAVYKRDNYTCVQCGEDKQYLNADHIVQFALMLRIYNIKTLEEAEVCEGLWDIENGRTLCLPCHKLTDTYLNKGKQYLKLYGV